MLKEEIQEQLTQAALDIREEHPLVASITNTVTVNFVANTQLAVGASAAMVYLPDEGEKMAGTADALYINTGTLFPIYEQTLPRTGKALAELEKPWVLDPVAIGIGDLRTGLIRKLKEYKPSIISGNASEIISLAHLWELMEDASEGPRGVDSIQRTDEAKEAAISLADWTGGAVSVSGKVDLITDGKKIAYYEGGSPFMEKITGFGCTLAGVTASFAAVSSPFIAAMTASALYKLAGNRTAEKVIGPGNFQSEFINQLYQASPEDIGQYPFKIETIKRIHRENFDLSSCFVVGPENTRGRPVHQMVEEAVRAGFKMIQIRSKIASAKELLQITEEAADVIAELGKENEMTLLVNDRLDIVLAAREAGIKVDGIHVGQSDIPVEVCRKYLGEEAIIGLSAPTEELFEYIQQTDVRAIDYFGAGPLRETATKPDCGLVSDGSIVTRNFEEMERLAALSPIPIVIGGGVKKEDLIELAETGVDGFFVVSAIAESENPRKAATELVDRWDAVKEYSKEKYSLGGIE